MRLLLLGDVVGRPGRSVVKDRLPALRERLALNFVVLNGENASGGFGLTPDCAKYLLSAGVDAITSGNHIWKQKSIYQELNENTRLLRPANYPVGAAGTGLRILPDSTGAPVAVINIMGRSFMDVIDCPFQCMESLLAQIPQDVRVRVVDFHAEATGEKKAMASLLDGKVSVLAGTHTHVQTNDAQILPRGTAYISDLGMCGVEASSLGMDASGILARLRTGLPQRYEIASGTAGLNGLFVEIDETNGLAVAVAAYRPKALAPAAPRPAWLTE